MGLLSMFGYKKPPVNRIINRDPNNQRNFNGYTLEGRTGLAGSRLTINSRQSAPLAAKPRVSSRLDLK